MELHSIVCCPLGISSSRGCTFHSQSRNLLLPSSSLGELSKIHFLDLKIMVKPSKERGAKFYDAFFRKKISSFVRDRNREENHDRLLVVLISYGRVLITSENSSIVFSRTYFKTKNRRESYLYILSFGKDDDFGFDLIDDEDENKSYSLQYDAVTKTIEVIDYSEENLRYKQQPPTLFKWVWGLFENSIYPWKSKWRS